MEDSINRENLIGNTYGYLTVEEMLYDYNNTGRTYCSCKCECGKKGIIKNSYKLKTTSNEFTSCGCHRRDSVLNTFSRDATGERYGRLVILEILWSENPIQVKCKCDCGNIVVLNKKDVLCGRTKSCGCLQKEMVSKTNTKDWTGYISDCGVEFISKSYKNKSGQWIWSCKCPMCGSIFTALPAKIRENTTTSCGCKISSSRERIIKKYLDENNIKYEQQYSFDDCRYKYKLKFDFAIFNGEKLLCLIEYDGIQHFEPVEIFGGEEQYRKNKIRDEIKNVYCKENKIELIRLKYDLTDNEIINKINEIINIINP